MRLFLRPGCTDWTYHLAGERILVVAGGPRARYLFQYLSVESIKEV